MYRCNECVTTHQLIYTDLLLLLPIFQMHKSTSLDKNEAKQGSHGHGKSLKILEK